MREEFNATKSPVGERKERHRQGAGAARGDRGRPTHDLEQAQRELRPTKRPARAAVRHAASSCRSSWRRRSSWPRRASSPACCATRVTEEEIARIVERWTGIPVAKLMEGEREKLLHLEDILHQRVIGQDEAVDAWSPRPSSAPAQASQDPNRPIGSFLFLGPTGVGKTELAKTLADTLCSTTKRTWCAST